MKIADYDILVEKGKWVEDRLYHPDFYQDVMRRLEHLIQHPHYPAYLQRGELKTIRRIRMGDNRVYAKVYPQARMVTVLAVVARGAINRDEVGGALDWDFTIYLQTHSEQFLPDRFVSMRDLAAEEEEQQTETAPVHWNMTFQCSPLGELEAMDILNRNRPAHGPGADFKVDPFCDEVLRKVEMAGAGDKVVVGLPEREKAWERVDIQTLQNSIRRVLTFFGKHYSIAFDDIAQKIVLVPPAKKGLYLISGKGRRTATSLDFEAPGRV